MKKHQKPQKRGTRDKTVKTASVLFLTLVFALMLSGAASAGTPLAENQTGTVSGDLYVNTTDGWPSSTQGATNEVTQANTLPAYTSIDSAMVYVNVYSGSGSNNWPVRTTIKLDGNGDGDYDDPGELLGVEDMNIPGSPDGTVYWLNDHCNRVYSDYQVWYDVKNLITSNNPTLYVKTENMGGDGYDGRIKMLALCVAYNDGDSDKVDYWVLNGQDWINTGSATSTFNTDTFNGQVSSATLNTVALASTDGTYALNTSSLTGNLTETGSYYKEHQWDVTSIINSGVDTNLTYANVGSSLKINLATLAIREAAAALPVADFTADKTSGTAPLTINFTNTSTGTITSYAWDFNNDGVTDSTDANPSWTYTNAGSYTVNLTATGPGGTDTETKTNYITIVPSVNTSLAGGTYSTTQTVTLTSDDPTATIYYANDTTDPRTSGTRITYTGPITISNTTTLRYAAISAEGNWSPLYLQNYVIGTGGLADTAQPKYLNNLENTGQSAYTGPSTPNIVWTYTTSEYVRGSAVVGADGTIYIGTTGSRVFYALNPDGTLKWSYTTGYQINSSPAIGTDGTIYLGGGDNYLYAFNPDGTVKWKYDAGAGAYSSPTIGVDGTIYCATVTGFKLYALNPDGTLKWSYTTGNKIYGSPAIGADGTIYIGSCDKKFYALNPDGTLKWSYSTGGEIRGSAAIGSDGTIYFESYDGYFYSLNSDGTLKWRYYTNHKPISSVTLNSPAIATDGTIYVGSYDKKLYALNPDGTLKWTYTTGGTISGSPAIGADGTIYIGSNGKTLYALNPDGTLKWSYTSSSSIQSVPAIGADGTLYIASYEGKIVYAFRDVAPVANFTSSVVNGTAGYIPLTVQFTDTSVNYPSSWLWDFGDGNTSTEKNPLHTYTSPGTYTVKLTASNNGGSDDEIKTDYIMLTTPSAPVSGFTATPLSGITPVTVQFTDQSTGINIAWAWDFNNDGVVDSTLQNPTYTYNTAGNYTVKLTVSNAGGSNSEVKTDYINVLADTEAPVVSSSPSGGNYTAAQLVSLTATDNRDPHPVIYYTRDGSNPTTSSTVYTSPISITSTTTLKFIATDMNGNVAPIQTETYNIIDNEAPNVTANPIGGTFTSKTTIALSVTDNLDPNPVIYYTLDGSNPTTSSTQYTGTINITETTNLKFIAVDATGNVSPVQTETYTIHDTEAPNVTATQNWTTITLSATDNADPNPAIYYTTNGDEPTTSSTPYSGPFTIPPAATTVVNFIAVDASGNTSPVQSRSFNTTRTTDILTQYYVEGHIGVVVDNGGTSYNPGDPVYNLSLPADATILAAHLYVAWNWYGYFGNSISFNGNSITTPLAHYADGNDGQDVFDVTQYFNPNGTNTAIIYPGNSVGNYGRTLVVIYQSASEPYRKIWINEGYDIIPSYSGYGATEGPGYAYFNNVTTNNINSAQVITILPSGDNDSPNIQLNGQTFTINSTGGSDPSFKYYNITPTALQNGTNIVEVPNGGYMSISNAILTLTMQPADITITNLQTNNPQVGTSSPVTATITNNGGTDASNFLVKLYDNNIQVAKTTITSLAAGSSLPVSFDWTPSTTGNHVLAIITDAGSQITESDENNNLVSAEVAVSPSVQPDLIATNLMLPVSPVIGTTSPVTVNITNQGAVDSSAFVVKLYDNNIQYATINLTGLAAGTSTDVIFDWLTYTTGQHNLSVIADANQQITEYNESNNQISQQASVSQSTLPDLLVSNLQVPGSPVVATTSLVTATVTNLGTVDSGAFVVKLYDNNTQIAKINIIGLAAGASTDVTFNWSTLTSGAHNLSVIADANQQITEYNENNNQISQQATVNPSAQPDLTVTDLQLPANPVAGITYQITATVTNLGTVDAGAFAVKLYDNNTQLGKINITSLAAGTSTQVIFNWTPPTGTHNLAIKADANQQITEYNEANNQISQQATVN